MANLSSVKPWAPPLCVPSFMMLPITKIVSSTLRSLEDSLISRQEDARTSNFLCVSTAVAWN